MFNFKSECLLQFSKLIGDPIEPVSPDQLIGSFNLECFVIRIDYSIAFS